ncbi:MAG: tRNA (guanosine(46)-N7)-methyltransferase TrmB [Candidatus Omnitrophota bacterium]
MARAFLVPNPINFRESENGATLVNHIGKKSKTRVEEKYDSVVFSECFGNSHPVEMEIGCGKGKFLVARAIENPGTNFFGIDRVSKFMNIGKTRAQKRALPNIRFLRAEARAFLTEAVAPLSVSIFHLYFPDPWPKRRHQARRVFTSQLLELLHARLVPGGLVEIATDDKDYFAAMQKTIAATAQLWENVREAVNERILDGMNKTNYELKWAAKGRSLYYTELKKR